MTGYCEVCESECEGKKEEHGAYVCSTCESDLIMGVHVEEDEYEEELELDEWLLQQG